MRRPYTSPWINCLCFCVLEYAALSRTLCMCVCVCSRICLFVYAWVMIVSGLWMMSSWALIAQFGLNFLKWRWEQTCLDPGWYRLTLSLSLTLCTMPMHPRIQNMRNIIMELVSGSRLNVKEIFKYPNKMKLTRIQQLKRSACRLCSYSLSLSKPIVGKVDSSQRKIYCTTQTVNCKKS